MFFSFLFYNALCIKVSDYYVIYCYTFRSGPKHLDPNSVWVMSINSAITLLALCYMRVCVVITMQTTQPLIFLRCQISFCRPRFLFDIWSRYLIKAKCQRMRSQVTLTREGNESDICFKSIFVVVFLSVNNNNTSTVPCSVRCVAAEAWTLWRSRCGMKPKVVTHVKVGRHRRCGCLLLLAPNSEQFKCFREQRTSALLVSAHARVCVSSAERMRGVCAQMSPPLQVKFGQNLNVSNRTCSLMSTAGF